MGEKSLERHTYNQTRGPRRCPAICRRRHVDPRAPRARSHTPDSELSPLQQAHNQGRGTSMTPAIGAHVSASGGLWTAVERGLDLGAEAIQIFGSAPQTWRPTKHTDIAYQRFKDDRAASGLKAVWLHCSYL